MRRMNSEVQASSGDYVIYKSLIIQIESCDSKLFFLNQLNSIGSQQDLDKGVRSPSELPIIEIELDIIQDEE